MLYLFSASIIYNMSISFVGSGLQLYVGKDGTVTFDKNSSRLTNDYQPVVIEGPR